MRLRLPARWSAACVLLLSGLGCAADPTAATSVTMLQLLPDIPVQILVGDSIQLRLIATDQEGRELGFPSPLIQARSSAPPVATVSENGLVRVSGPGSAWMVVEADGVASDSVLIIARQPSGSFHLTLLFAPDIPDTVRSLFEAAARRWEGVMEGELESVDLETTGGDCPAIEGEPPTPPLGGTERGALVYIGQSGHFPPAASIDAVAGVCLQRPLPRPTTILGQVTLNRARPMDRFPTDHQRFVAVHELGHSLGLVGIVQGEQPQWFDIATGRFTGPMGLEGYRRITGTFRDALSARSGHWDGVPVTDVMSGGSLISLVSIGALFDMGYPARWTGAGPL